MDEVHELSRADKMAKTIADIMERLIALEKKIDALTNVVVSGAGRGRVRPGKYRGKNIRKQTQKNKSRS